VNELDSMQHAAALAAADVVAAAGDDAALASRAAQGDQTAFARIMRRYNQRLYRLAVSVLGDASEAEDVLQESYVRAFYAFATYAGTGSLGAWLARIVRNEAIDRVRARDSRRSHVAIEADLGVLSAEGETNVGDDDLPRAPSARLDLQAMTDPQALASNAELRRLLERAIQRLPEQFRTAFVLREVEGLSVEETAEYLGIPPATVKTRDHRARNLLRSYLSENIDATIPQTFPFLGARCDQLVARVLQRLKV
jgi:RNA polymerase sigma-70 factor (ECF subfamily)